MDSFTAATLLDLNRRFYEQFGTEFAQTRQRIQNGVRRVLDSLPDTGAWLDVGCGSGSLAAAWVESGRTSAYLGLDFSEALLAEARKAVPREASLVSFRLANLADPHWAGGLEGPFTGVLAFAVLHHLPSRALRERVLRQIYDLMAPGGRFYHSEWQFQHAPKLMARRLPWSTIDLDESMLEPGDTLLDWRFRLPGKGEQTGLRYVHLFDEEELANLAGETGFKIIDQFESDGQGGRLGLYQVWEVISE